MTKEQLQAAITEKLGDKMTLLDTGRHDLMYEVKKENLLEVCKTLKEDESLAFDYYLNSHGVDTGEKFEAVYNLASIIHKTRIDFKVILPYDSAEIESVQKIWPGANWFEREMWELYGINVLNHGNLTRFLLEDNWDKGFPMRKDWDAPGFIRMPEL